MGPPEFIFITCQRGAEPVVKAELARDWPALRFAYSRPGFLTFKLPPDHGLNETCEIGSVFARAAGFSLGKAVGGSAAERAATVWELAGARPFVRLHVWQRDRTPPGDREISAIPSPEVIEAEQAIRSLWPADHSTLAAHLRRPAAPPVGAPTRRGDLVLDCVLVEPDQWWIGFHRAASVPSFWPGGLFPDELPPDAVSRAYLKLEEAIAWSRMRIKRNDLCVELGSAPGGAAQALLRHGARVIGIDPADMDQRVLADPNFEHWKKRGADVRRREFREVRWLVADMNVAPQYTLDAVESIVTHQAVHIAGLLLTLKLPDMSLATEIPNYLARIRGWGYAEVAARQLHHNRHEFCVAAHNLQPVKRKKQRPQALRAKPAAVGSADPKPVDLSASGSKPRSGAPRKFRPRAQFYPGAGGPQAKPRRSPPGGRNVPE
jgi:23S rRNA (cytidine2498-2'-O)-methyltransferase